MIDSGGGDFLLVGRWYRFFFLEAGLDGLLCVVTGGEVVGCRWLPLLSKHCVEYINWPRRQLCTLINDIKIIPRLYIFLQCTCTVQHTSTKFYPFTPPSCFSVWVFSIHCFMDECPMIDT